jgi:hypothetical protein
MLVWWCSSLTKIDLVEINHQDLTQCDWNVFFDNMAIKILKYVIFNYLKNLPLTTKRNDNNIIILMCSIANCHDSRNKHWMGL